MMNLITEIHKLKHALSSYCVPDELRVCVLLTSSQFDEIDMEMLAQRRVVGGHLAAPTDFRRAVIMGIEVREHDDKRINRLIDRKSFVDVEIGREVWPC